MHSSRMCTARSLTVSRHILCTPHNHACCPTAMHAPLQPCMPPAIMHTCPPQPHMPPSATMHAPQQPRTPPTTHAPGNHAHPWQPRTLRNHTCPPATMHNPRQQCTPPCGQTHTCKNMTFANYVCGQ